MWRVKAANLLRQVCGARASARARENTPWNRAATRGAISGCPRKIAVIPCGVLFLLLCAQLCAESRYPLKWEDTSRKGACPKSLVELRNGVLVSAESHWTSTGAELRSYRSSDCGTTWTAAGLIAADRERGTDLGDGAFLLRRDGELLVAYRHNYYRRRPAHERRFSIQIASSRDDGASWRHHSTVAESHGTTAGLWASFLFETKDGQLQCYYDDEVTPWREGYNRHQWLTMKTWDAARESWTSATTVSRAHDRKHLSRDGMCTVLEIAPEKLLCVFESVDVSPPHKGVLRKVTSEDNGGTWSWQKKERPIVWRPENPTYNALAPWTIRLRSGPLVCVFVTDEDRETPDIPATGRLNQDVKAVYSFDEGATWSKRPQTVSDEHPCYLPGLVQLKHGSERGRIVLQYHSAWTSRLKFGWETSVSELRKSYRTNRKSSSDSL